MSIFKYKSRFLKPFKNVFILILFVFTIRSNGFSLDQAIHRPPCGFHDEEYDDYLSQPFVNQCMGCSSDDRANTLGVASN